MSLLTQYPQLQIIQDIAKQKNVKVHLVGGFLRDFFLQRPCLDFDFAVECQALPFARQFARRIRGAFILLDEEHGCGRVVKKQKKEMITFDFADFRAADLSKDLLHRDFTINTLSIEMNSLRMTDEVDHVAVDLRKGKRDLRTQRIRMASVKAFRDDPLRLLRAYSLRAMLDFKIEQKTLQQIKKDKKLIRGVSPERIRDELFKILESERAAVNLRAMDRVGLLEHIIPQITIMYQVKQGTYHHLDVWPHSLETVLQLEKIFSDLNADPDIREYFDESLGGYRLRRALVKLGALLHDIGKPETRKRAKGRISFHSHERVGKNIVRFIAKNLKLSTRERHALEDMVLWHLRPGYLSNFKKPSDKAIYRYFRDTQVEAVSIALLSLADQRATRGPATTEQDQKHHEKICMRLVKKYFEKKKEKPFVRLIDGHDLIRDLKLTPSPLFGKILTEVEEQQVTGKIQTKKQAIALAKKVTLKKKRSP